MNLKLFSFFLCDYKHLLEFFDYFHAQNFKLKDFESFYHQIADMYVVNVRLHKSLSDLYQSRYNLIPLVGLIGLRANQINMDTIS